METSSVKEIIKDSDTIIVSFGSRALHFGHILPFEFLRFLDTSYPNTSKLFVVDKAQNSYHSGIEGISKNIDETTKYLHEKIKSYKYIYFLGISSGGYASILFGSLLNVTAIIAFIPQTIRDKKTILTYVDDKYADLVPFINATTKYFLYADSTFKNENDPHHISQCTRISHNTNVSITIKKKMKFSTMKTSGELFEIINNVIISK